MTRRLLISIKEARELMDAPTVEFPKYASPLLNLANRNAQGTRPRVVDDETIDAWAVKMSELIQQFSGKSPLDPNGITDLVS